MKLPSASRVRAVGVPPSMLIVAPATPDRLSTICPLNVMLVRVTAGVVLSSTTGGSVSVVWANRASTCWPTSVPSCHPAVMENMK